jgi:hypothetical protein
MFGMHEFCLVFLKEFLTPVGLLNESKGLFVWEGSGYIQNGSSSGSSGGTGVI